MDIYPIRHNVPDSFSKRFNLHYLKSSTDANDSGGSCICPRCSHLIFDESLTGVCPSCQHRFAPALPFGKRHGFKKS